MKFIVAHIKTVIRQAITIRKDRCGEAEDVAEERIASGDIGTQDMESKVEDIESYEPEGQDKELD